MAGEKPTGHKASRRRRLRSGLLLALVTASSTVSACTSGPDEPPGPAPRAESYSEPEHFTWGFSHTFTYWDCSKKPEKIDLDNIGAHPDPKPGIPDIKYEHVGCSRTTHEALKSAAINSFVSWVREGRADNPFDCYDAAHKGPPEVTGDHIPSHTEKTFKEAGIFKGEIFCVVTDLGRVARLKITDVIPADLDMHSPFLFGEGQLWTPEY
ncbi:hypothetical protein Tcur_4699 [Thermomonospora curvata DSM 43183]|uniref:Lipoprotein n=1 Tax=Thermomonospora curvata (strain ATCC 19995 / DSM 43183 / JCM 3096 / KCTC 9072 / NBRC 15933 / NCIMB 10081 / Henssen B9) TaxID=471852 RepID=D1A6C2_THECD|nr:hypothetical protein Tcur_4699 [Thermomonospora curvata DSM 43183]